MEHDGLLEELGYQEPVQTTLYDYSEVESATVELFRAEIIQLNDVINIILIVTVIAFVGWLVTLRVLKKILKQREVLKEELGSLKESLRLSQRMLKVQNCIVLDEDEDEDV